MSARKHSQRGFAITALTAVLSVLAFIFILGYSSYYSKRQSLTLVQAQQEYVVEAKARLLEAYAANALQVDSDLTYTAYRTEDAWLAMGGISKKWGVSVDVSDRISREGVKYTSVTLWLPTEADGTNPRTFDTATGVFKSCATAPCPPRVYTTFDGLGIQLDARNKTYAILNTAAVKAQAFFKARYLADVVRDISTNHFRAPRGTCSGVNAEELPCIDIFTAIKNTPLPGLIGLDSQALTNAWGTDIEVTNFGGGAKSDSAPYTMAFSTRDPWGGTPIVIYAVQPL